MNEMTVFLALEFVLGFCCGANACLALLMILTARGWRKRAKGRKRKEGVA